MLAEICAEIKNYFTHYDNDVIFGDFAIQEGHITPSIDFPTDYIRVIGSYKNDGVHKLSDNDLIDEATFHGAIWIMSPPADFLQLVSEIEEWQNNNGKADSQAMSPFQSESFGGYSYSKGSGSNSSSGGGSSVPTWQSTYASRLNVYRRIRVL